MQKIAICFFFLYFSIVKINAQTTDLSIVVEAQDLSGSPVSNVNIYQDFQYIVTIINSGNAVNNVTFLQILNPDITYISATSQNESGGASAATGLNFATNTLAGTIANMPINSSVEVRVLVKATLTPGGVATNAEVFPPNGTTDTNTSNNISIISIDVNDLPIDFSVIYSQTTPPEGTGISAWGDTVTYQFTITNNSAIAFPLDGFTGRMQLVSNPNFGLPNVELSTINCIGSTNGMACPDVSGVALNTTNISFASPLSHTLFSFNDDVEFPIGGSLTFEIDYTYLEPTCGLEDGQLIVDSFIAININHSNQSSNTSNVVETPLIQGTACPLTDICIETTQVNPAPSQTVNWNEEVTFETIVCNNGPLDAPMRFFLQNLSVNIDWDIISITCDATTGPITCNDFTLTDQDIFWESSVFTLPANTTITITTVAIFLEPADCSTGNEQNSMGHVRSGTNLLSTTIFDSDLINNAESDFVLLPPLPICPPEDITDLSVTKTQINPVLPDGGSVTNTISWGEVTYEITVTNPSLIDAMVRIVDFMPNGANTLTEAELISVECVSTTGTANCITVTNNNIGVVLDGEPQGGNEDVFWQILQEDNYTLPAESSVTFNVVVNWLPDCSENPIPATNAVVVTNLTGTADNNITNNFAEEITYFAPCVDLVVQTYPEFTTVPVNQTFNWIIDITNSNTSSNAINIDFIDTLGPEFTIAGTPTCTVTAGNATCTTFMPNGNTITGTIPNMDAASSIQITIPVTAPGFGGAFTNTAEAIPNLNDNEELTPETNISISNVQVIAPIVTKTFTPDSIIVGGQSVLEFTVTNINTNPAQSDISFTDNLPSNVSISCPIMWVNQNGCSATFTGNVSDTRVEVSNLSFPNGVASCSFSVPVTSSIDGVYLNNSSNFSDQNNIDTSQANATLTVLPDNSNVDIEVLKSVLPTEASIGENVIFTITATNVGTTTGTNVVLFESLPASYNYVSSSTSLGVYDNSTFLWTIGDLNPNQQETLTIETQVISSENLINTASLNSVSEIDRDVSNNEDTAEVTLNGCLIVPQGFSPNTDGSNDFFAIPCIEDYTGNNLKVFNRYGTLLYEANNYINNWDGIPNKGFPKTNKVLPTGTYYYVLTINGIEKPFVGWVYINY